MFFLLILFQFMFRKSFKAQNPLSTFGRERNLWNNEKNTKMKKKIGKAVIFISCLLKMKDLSAWSDRKDKMMLRWADSDSDISIQYTYILLIYLLSSVGFSKGSNWIQSFDINYGKQWNVFLLNLVGWWSNYWSFL